MTEKSLDDISVDDVEDVTEAELEAVEDVSDAEQKQPEYWVDYQIEHHGIIYCWRNNRKQILLGVEESIAPHTDAYDIVLLTAEGEFIVSIGEYETETDALQQALLIQKQYPLGEIPEVNEWQEEQDTPSESNEDFKEASEDAGILGNIKNVLYKD